MTNLLVAATISSYLITNVATVYETQSVPIPCPDGQIGCLVYHSKDVPHPNPSWRRLTTTVQKVTETSIPSLGITNKVFERIHETDQYEVRTNAWVPAPKSFGIMTWNLFAAGTNLTSTNVVLWNYNYKTNITVELE